MEEQPNSIEPTQGPARPLLLTVLCILTFIGSGWNLISGIFIFSFYDAFQPLLEGLIKTTSLPGLELLMGVNPAYYLVSSLLYALSFSGAWLMFNLRKTGFHLYTIAQILLIIATMYFFKLPIPSVFDLILSGIFILLYASKLKIMK